MLVNYQTNYCQPSFERFRFSDNAKKVVLNKINTPAKFKKFKELCEQEETGDRASRNIDIFLFGILLTDCSLKSVTKNICRVFFNQQIHS